jgi:hypothetical protein
VRGVNLRKRLWRERVGLNGHANVVAQPF